MDRFRLTLIVLALAAWSLGAQAGPARIVKVLPHFLDQDGRASRTPSLYDRDAYQAFLRRNPSQCAGLRFDVQWRPGPPASGQLKLRVEFLGSKTARARTVEQPVRRNHWYHRWSAVDLDPEAFQQLGELIAWRATLWDGDRLLAEQKSFLW